MHAEEKPPAEDETGTKVRKTVDTIIQNLKAQMPDSWTSQEMDMDSLKTEALKLDNEDDKQQALKAIRTMSTVSLVGVPQKATPCGVENFGLPSLKLQACCPMV